MFILKILSFLHSIEDKYVDNPCPLMSNFAFFFLNKDMLTLAKYVNEFEGGPNDQNDIYRLSC